MGSRGVFAAELRRWFRADRRGCLFLGTRLEESSTERILDDPFHEVAREKAGQAPCEVMDHRTLEPGHQIEARERRHEALTGKSQESPGGGQSPAHTPIPLLRSPYGQGPDSIDIPE